MGERTATKLIGTKTNATIVNTLTTRASWLDLCDRSTIAAVPRKVRPEMSLLSSLLRKRIVSRSFAFCQPAPPLYHPEENKYEEKEGRGRADLITQNRRSCN
jgi:hypothetical protein